MTSPDTGLAEVSEAGETVPVTLVRTPFVSTGSPSLGVVANELMMSPR